MLKFTNDTHAARQIMTPLAASRAKLKPGTPLLIQFDGIGGWLPALFVNSIYDSGIRILANFRGTPITALSSPENKVEVLKCNVTICFEEEPC